jgi:2-polyprenyl-3-methyl-5-hydroxy-6-metoxy-1,4-benzoquinol methylase
MKSRELFYDSIAKEFDSMMNSYDLQRRLEIIYDELLPDDITDKRTIDLGCGTGWFSKKACERNAQLISLDISEKLVQLTRKRTKKPGVISDASNTPFSPCTFDIVVSSEMLEHLYNPASGIIEIDRILAPGGIVIITTPNRRWQWLVILSTKLGLRPFEGYENFLGFEELKQLLLNNGFVIEEHKGFHLLPFQISFIHPFLRLMDRLFDSTYLGEWMINQAVRARKQS